MMTVEWVHDYKELKTGPGDAVLIRRPFSSTELETFTGHHHDTRNNYTVHRSSGIQIPDNQFSCDVSAERVLPATGS